jgi:hypothetical protein
MALMHAFCKGAAAPIFYTIFYIGRENGLPPGKPFVAPGSWVRHGTTLGEFHQPATDGSGYGIRPL